MALINCKTCKKEVSDEAKTCPHCGGKLKMSILKKIGIGFLAFMVIGVVMESMQSPEQKAETAKRRDIGIAEAACQLTFEKMAKNPNSVDWIRNEREFAYLNTEKTKAISTQPVRAKNSFNATIISVVVCTLEKTNASWSVVKIKEKTN